MAHVLRAIAQSEWAPYLVLRGSALMRTWFGDAADVPERVCARYRPARALPVWIRERFRERFRVRALADARGPAQRTWASVWARSCRRSGGPFDGADRLDAGQDHLFEGLTLQFRATCIGEQAVTREPFVGGVRCTVLE